MSRASAAYAAETPEARRRRHRAEHEARERGKRLEDLERRLAGLRQERDQAVREYAARLRNMLFGARGELAAAEGRAAQVPRPRGLIPALARRSEEADAAEAAVEQARAVLALIEAEVARAT